MLFYDDDDDHYFLNIINYTVHVCFFVFDNVSKTTIVMSVILIMMIAIFTGPAFILHTPKRCVCGWIPSAESRCFLRYDL